MNLMLFGAPVLVKDTSKISNWEVQYPTNLYRRYLKSCDCWQKEMGMEAKKFMDEGKLGSWFNPYWTLSKID